ncbi:unnamed protein product [Brassicogethes aeneus]|uniref:SAGA-associated factor 11 n=1 Tax=Brassicogethes aeneus TaxID=1431903 RepID=A0A9P0FC63_BRAAE|nr:unnamed protein product [Brassicogethes aeneus]
MSKRPNPDRKQLFNSLAKDFHELVQNKHELKASINNFFYNLVDEMAIGIIFDLHRKYKTNAYELDDSQDEEENKDVDVFAEHNLKKTQECVCPNCDRAVAAIYFAPHLEKCMGMGRASSRSRNATRRVVANNKDSDGGSYSGVASDDDKDVNWNLGDKRRKKKTRNGSKKSKGSTKKNYDSEPLESLNVDVEGDDDDLTNLRDILHLQDHSNSTSPADSASSSQSSSSKKKDKSKSKKSSKRDKSSPSSSLAAD